MPVDGEKLDELLSGFLDGRLDSQEMELVQDELQRRESVRRRLDELKEMQSDLQNLFQAPSPSLGDDFSARVIAEAQRQAVQAGLPEEHHVRKAEQAAIVHFSRGVRFDWGKVGKTALALGGLAAAIVLAINLPGFLSQNNQPDGVTVAQGDDTKNPFPADGTAVAAADNEPDASNPALPFSASEDEEPRFVSQMNFNQHVVVVVNLEISPEAAKNKVFDRILRTHGILDKKPIIADSEVEKAVSDSRATVQDEDDDENMPDALIYMMRAGHLVLGTALDEIYKNREDFPKISFDIAIDNPTVSLMQKIARSTGVRFATNKPFAAPVVVSEAARSGTQLSGTHRPIRFVSNEQREAGFSEGFNPFGQEAKNLTTVLVFVREQE